MSGLGDELSHPYRTRKLDELTTRVIGLLLMKGEAMAYSIIRLQNILLRKVFLHRPA